MVDDIRDILEELEIETNTVLAPVVAAALTNAFYTALLVEARERGPGRDASRMAARGVKEVYEALAELVGEEKGEDFLF